MPCINWAYRTGIGAGTPARISDLIECGTQSTVVVYSSVSTDFSSVFRCPQSG